MSCSNYIDYSVTVAAICDDIIALLEWKQYTIGHSIARACQLNVKGMSRKELKFKAGEEANS